MNQRTVVICADDFGQHEGINNACLQLARQGRISAVSCLAGGPAWRGAEDTVAQLARLPVEVGLHLDFTDYPTDAGMRHTLAALIGLAFARRLDGARVGREINAQLEAFERVAGRAPDHVDGHQHVHQFPVIRDQLLQVLARRYPQRKPWIRRTAATAVAGTPRFKPFVIECLGGEALSRRAQRENFRQNLHLHGVYGFDADEAGYTQLLVRWLDAAVSGDVLMCHPGYAGTAPDAIGAARETELRVLASSWFGGWLADSRLVTGRLP